MANSVHPFQTPRAVVSDLGIHCFLRPLCPNTYDKYMYSNLIKSISSTPPPLQNVWLPINYPGSDPASELSQVYIMYTLIPPWYIV